MNIIIIIITIKIINSQNNQIISNYKYFIRKKHVYTQWKDTSMEKYNKQCKIIIIRYSIYNINKNFMKFDWRQWWDNHWLDFQLLYKIIGQPKTYLIRTIPQPKSLEHPHIPSKESTQV